MKHTANQLMLALVLCTSLGIAPWGRAQPTQAKPSARVAALVTRLTAPALTWQKRFEAETALMKMPSETVLLALVPEIAKGMPSTSLIANGTGSAQTDAKSIPPVWQIYYAVGRLWAHHDQQSLSDKKHPYTSVSRALVAALPTARSLAVLSELGSSGSSDSYWSAGAEQPVLALFRGSNNSASVRLAALECLLQNTGMKHYSEAIQIEPTWPRKTWQQLNDKAEFVSLLMHRDWRTKNNLSPTEVDRDVLKIGFALLPAMEKNKAGGGYFLAVTLGRYVGQSFTPDPSSPTYSPQRPLGTSFFATTSTNALKWWQKHANKKS